MSTKKRPAPKKAIKKDPMTLPKKFNLIFKKPTKESYDGKRQYPSSIEDCCEKVPDNYDRDAELMKQASKHIRGLQETLGRQSLRLDMFDKCYNLFTGNNRNGGSDCCGQDIAYSLERRADERVEELKSKPQS